MVMAETLPEITEVQRLTLKPGDRLIVRSPDRISNEVAALVAIRVRRVLRLPDDVPVLVLPEDMTLEVAGDG
jgi:hypothetical protein